MDKNAIKKYAVWARRELISRVSQRAALYEITADGYGDQNATSVHGRVLSAEEKKQRQALIAQIREKGYEQVMEEIAYTWFNRFSALRFMEVNGYLPSRVRVFTDDGNAFKPQILTEAINLELDGLSMDKVYELKNANDDDALFKYLIIIQCNALSSILPGMFQRISDYTELLFPDNLLREGSVIEQMVTTIPESDWTGQVEIIGWLYQYYISEKHEEVVKAVGKVTVMKDDVPAATQLFTPDWIVRYMVENSLGRLWLEGHPNDDLKSEWKYYLDEAEQEPEVQAQLAEIRKEYAVLKPEDILTIDPCQGSGHILAYMFDVLVQIYEAYGYSAREAVASIVEHNIWGLDIDDRAAQLAYFSVMMKARQYDARFFKRGIQPHVYAIIESNNIDPQCIEYFADGRPELKSAMDTLVKELHDAKEYGSILNVTQVNFDALYARFDEIRNEAAPSMYTYQAIESLLPFVQVAQTMAQKYHAVVTNPPYLNRMSPKLKEHVLVNYKDYSGDLFAVFTVRDLEFCKHSGFSAMMTPNVWMFIKTYEELRKYIVAAKSIDSLVQLAKGSFFREAAVDIATFVLRNTRLPNYRGTYVRLEDFKADMDVQRSKVLDAAAQPTSDYIYTPPLHDFQNIEAYPIAYWCTDKLYEHFRQAPKLSEISAPRQGLATADNNRFLRLWYELNYSDIGFGLESCDDALRSGYKWFPYNKGGAFRRWYGNKDYVVNWKNDGEEIKNFKDDKGKVRSRPQNLQFYFHQSITWSDITSGSFSGRFSEKGSIFDVQGSSAFPNDSIIFYLLGFMNSSVSQEILKMLNPTLHTQVGDLSRLPVVIDNEKKEEIDELVKSCVDIAKCDWDLDETSWNYCSPYGRRGYSSVKEEIEALCVEQQDRFNTQMKNEIRLNELFIEIYGLQGEMKAEVLPENITVRLPDFRREVKSLISYAVGCIFGRYALNVNGLSYAGGTWNPNLYTKFRPDEDGIIPISDDEYFSDDIVSKFSEFIGTVYGKESLESNLSYIANALGGQGYSRDVIRDYFMNSFYTDHCNMCSVTGSGKRPIYWLFDSGKKNGFKCLIYMHRYQPDTIARIRTDYVHEQQSRYRTAIADLESRIANAGTSERVKLTKQLKKLQDQAEEVRVYEEKIHHLADQMIKIDLDDGVKHNYAIFQDVLAKIK